MRMLGILMILGLVLGFVHGSDLNWGKKVPCFIVSESVVCPGCNYRAGLSCPRALKNSQNCLEPSTEPPQTFPTELAPKPHEDKKPVTDYEERSTYEITSSPLSNASVSIKYLNVSSTVEPLTTTKNTMDMALFLYRIFGEQTARQHYRYTREVAEKEPTEDDNEADGGEICYWNADCPCPQICCKTGPGCPKRCVMGIRLPPPWGR